MQEIELALVIYGQQPQRIVDELAALGELGSYTLRPTEARAICDTYVDTPDGTLGARQLSLRVRQVNGRERLTLKGGAEAAQGLKVRRELELAYSPEALQTVRAELEREGVSIPVSPAAFSSEGALAVLRSWGLTVIQERRNDRQTREVIAGGAILAELTLDAVTFCFGGQPIRHYEIEIELKPGVSPQAAREAADLLRARFPGRLRPWTVAKLTLGMWLERLQAEGKLARYLRADGTLAPEVYEIIAGGEKTSPPVV
jgi:inorganic triphosphatase YgiF